MQISEDGFQVEDAVGVVEVKGVIPEAVPTTEVMSFTGATDSIILLGIVMPI